MHVSALPFSLSQTRVR